MGYSARYHAASLAAVFHALAIGILIGAGIGDDVLSGTSQSLERSLEDDLQNAREREDELAGELERERTFGLRTYPALVDDRLRGRKVGVIALGALPEQLAGEIEATVDPTGARLSKVAVLRQPPDLSGLSGRLGESFRDLPQDPAQVERLGRKLGSQLVRGGGFVATAREQLLDRFSGSPGRLDDVIVVLAPPADLPSGEREVAGPFEDGVLAGIVAAGRPAVGVELRATSPSAVPAYAAHEIPTVDSLDLTSGKLAAVFALLGAKGDFGVKETADALLPEVVLPAPERGRSASRPAGGAADEPPGGAGAP